MPLRCQKFTFANYRGITGPLEIVVPTDGRPFCLVGDNEAGKTTILRGIEQVGELCRGVQLRPDEVDAMRPIGAMFEGLVTLRVEFDGTGLTDNDYKKMDVKKEKALKGKLVVAFMFDFRPSRKSVPASRITINGKPFNSVPQHLRDRVPQFAYHDDFSFEVPRIVDFSNDSRNDRTNQVWQGIFDNLFALSNQTKVGFKEGVIELSQQGDHALNMVSNRIDRMQDYLNEHIGYMWREMAYGQAGFKGFTIKVSPQNRLHYLIEVRDSTSAFPVSERSKGFKWFFCFVLMSELRSSRPGSEETVFLLDEPGNNIHIARQDKILESLLKIAKDDNSILFYSTHSPGLIDIEKTQAVYCRSKEDELAPINIQLEEALTLSDDFNITAVLSSGVQKEVVKRVKKNPKGVRKQLKAQMNRENVRTASTLIRDVINAIPAIFT